MIKAIISGLFTLVKYLIQLFFDPIFSLIESIFPDISNVFTFVNQMLNLVLGVSGYVLDLINLPTIIYVAIFGSLLFRFNLTFATAGAKKIIKWWNALVP